MRCFRACRQGTSNPQELRHAGPEPPSQRQQAKQSPVCSHWQHQEQVVQVVGQRVVTPLQVTRPRSPIEQLRSTAVQLVVPLQLTVPDAQVAVAVQAARVARFSCWGTEEVNRGVSVTAAQSLVTSEIPTASTSGTAAGAVGWDDVSAKATEDKQIKTATSIRTLFMEHAPFCPSALLRRVRCLSICAQGSLSMSLASVCALQIKDQPTANCGVPGTAGLRVRAPRQRRMWRWEPMGERCQPTVEGPWYSPDRNGLRRSRWR